MDEYKTIQNGYVVRKDDTRIQTNFSELSRCTPGQIHSVLNERAGITKPYASPGMDFGTSRHDEWRDEALETGRSAAVFKAPPLGFDIKAEAVEQEFASEVLPGVVLHSRIDLYGDAIAADYKTTTMNVKKAHTLYNASIQLKVYAYQLMIHDMSVQKLVYLLEHWNYEHTKVLGYSKVEKDYIPRYVSEAQSWIKRRALILKKGIQIAKEDGIL